jgi:hypothetical protein
MVVTAPPPPVVTAPPPPQVRRLPNGEPELALDASVVEMRAASKIQLQDLSRRRGEGRSKPLGRITSRGLVPFSTKQGS